MFTAVLMSSTGSVFDFCGRCKSAFPLFSHNAHEAHAARSSRVCSMVPQVIWYLLHTLYCTSWRSPLSTCVCLWLFFGAIMWLGIFHIHSTAIIRDHLCPYVSLHPSLCETKQIMKRKKQQILCELNQTFLSIHCQWSGDSSINENNVNAVCNSQEKGVGD